MLYTIRHILDTFDYSQQRLAEELTDVAKAIVAERDGPEAAEGVLVSQSDLSRIMGDKPRLIAEAVKRWLAERPRPWLELLASAKGDDVLKDYEGVFIFRPGTFSPKEGELPAEMWKLARLPVECVSPYSQGTTAFLIRHGPTAVWYWVPKSRVPRVRTMLQALRAEPHGLTGEELARVTVVAGPETLGVSPVAVIDPLSDHRLGFAHFTSRRPADVSITFSVMAEDVTMEYVMLLEPIYRDLVASLGDGATGACTGSDGFAWTATRGDALVAAPAG